MIHFSFFIFHFSFAQVGVWQSHASYRAGQSVAVVGQKVYAATLNGFFVYDKASGETTTLGKHTNPAFSDVGISRLLYVPEQNRLLVAYQNGNLDVATLSPPGEPASVQNISTILTATNLPASRSINHITRVGNTAYLSTDFGLVVFDLVRNEIRDTYFSRQPDGSPQPLLQTAATSDSLYALINAPGQTGNRPYGLRAVRLAAGVNIADPANWRSVPTPGQALESIASVQGRLVTSVNQQGVFERQTGRWVQTIRLTDPLIRVFSAPAGLLITTLGSVTTSVGNAQLVPRVVAREVVPDGNRVWVADEIQGVLDASNYTAVVVSGPSRDDFARLYAYPKTLIALPNGPFETKTSGFNYLQPGDSLSVPTGQWGGVFGPTLSYNGAAYLPTQQRLYLSTFGEFLGGNRALYTLLPADPTSFQTVTLPASVGPYITDIATDFFENLWISTGGPNAQRATLHVRRTDGAFQSFPAVGVTNIAQIVPDDNGFLWLRLDGSGGLLVFDPQTNRSRFLSTQTGNGGLLTNAVRSIAKDRTGAIWVGTDLGPTVFDNPAGVFDGAVDAQPPLLNRRRLLANQQITAIVVDGGNRKWLGTRNGLYRVAPDGSQLLETFTAENSPLPSNVVRSVAVEPTTGTVFVLTGPAERSYGIVSYGGSATEPAETLSNPITIFPNPVRPDFAGTVGIRGLTENAVVKIADAGGQLVYETRSQGGTATWDLRDYRGRSAQTGVYLILITMADGTEKLAGKLAVVR